jgi:hypothetical protein
MIGVTQLSKDVVGRKISLTKQEGILAENYLIMECNVTAQHRSYESNIMQLHKFQGVFI